MKLVKTHLRIALILTVARSALVAWSRLKPIETMVARCSSETLSVGVVPGPELHPGNTRGDEKSAHKKKEENKKNEESDEMII